MDDAGAVLPQHVAALAQGFTGDDAPRHGLERLGRIAVEMTGATSAAVVVGEPGRRPRMIAATDTRAYALHRLQFAISQGPSVVAYRSGRTVVVDDTGIAVAHPWPGFAAASVTAGFASAWSVPLMVAGERLGALGLLQERSGPVPDKAVAATRSLAGLAAALLACCRDEAASRRLVEQLRSALTTRGVIEQAKGRIAERHQLTHEAAFERIRRYARDRNLQLRSVAAAVARGELRL